MHDDIEGFGIEDEDIHEDSPNYPLFLLGKQNRYTILKELYNKSYNLSDLSKKVLNKERAEVNKIQKPVQLLLDSNIIAKNVDGKIYITNLGRRLYEMIDPIVFTWKRKDYFMNHVIEEPFSLFFSEQLLKDIRIIEGSPTILREMINIYNRADTLLYNILYDVYYHDELLDSLNFNLNKESFQSKTIFGRNSIRDPDWKNRYINFKEFKRSGRIEQRIIGKVKISLILTDTESLIFFPETNSMSKKELEQPDTTSAVYFKNNKFLHLICMDFFMKIWDSAKPFDHTQIKDRDND